MTPGLLGPPCIHCGLVTFANPCTLSVGLEPLVMGFAVECFLCKSKGPWAPTPEEAIQRYSPWVSFEQRKPLENQNVQVWDAEFCKVGCIHFSSALDESGRYQAMHFTYWAPVLLDPATYLRTKTLIPTVGPIGPEATEPTEPPADLCRKDINCGLPEGHDPPCVDDIPF